MKVFITGSTGFIGRHFLETLIASGFPKCDITLLQRRSLFFDSSIKVVKGKLEEIQSYKEDLLEADYVFHIAASADVGSVREDVWKDHQSLVTMLENLNESNTLKRFVFISTIGAFDRSPTDKLKDPISNVCKPSPRSEYGKVKLASEKVLKNSGLPYTIIRPSWVWGKGMRATSHLSFFNRLIEKKSPVARLGFPGKASFIHVEDLSQALIKIINDSDKHLNKEYFAATEKEKIATVLKRLWKLNDRSSWLIPLGMFRLLRPFHRFLPLAFNFLFLDYLTCKESSFTKEFEIDGCKELSHDLISVFHRDQYAIVTGANGGIGFELAYILRNRYHLCLIDKNIDRLKEKFPDSKIIHMDLSHRKQLEKLSLLNFDRKVGLLVNNAGVGFKSSFFEAPVSKDMLTIDVNIQAPILLTHFFKNDLVESRGTIVNVASSVAAFPLPFMSSYAASKAFILSWSQAIEEELKEKVNVVTFSPSGTRTNFQSQAGVKESKDLMGPSYVAQEILKLILKDRSDTKLIGLKSKVLKVIMTLAPRRVGLSFIGKLFQGKR